MSRSTLGYILLAALTCCAALLLYARPVYAARSCLGKDPAAVVRAYYAAAARHDAAGAQACLTAQYRTQLRSVIDPDWQNIASFRLLRIQVFRRALRDAPGNIRPLPYRLMLVTALYDVQWKQIAGSANGENLSFIYVEKEYRSSPWLIGGIGSGP